MYRLRSPAGRLSADDARTTGRVGWLEFTRTNRIGAPEECVRLFAEEGGYEVARLTCASLRFLRDGGMMFRGFQDVVAAGGDRVFNQSWWCVPIVNPYRQLE